LLKCQRGKGSGRRVSGGGVWFTARRGLSSPGGAAFIFTYAQVRANGLGIDINLHVD
jgi:hypothetical protein